MEITADSSKLSSREAWRFSTFDAIYRHQERDPMASMNISLPDPMRDWVQERVDSGQYAGASDYVRELIRRDQASTAERERWLAKLDASLEQALADADAGRVTDASEVFDRLLAKYEAMVPARGGR
jgi:antitoxin ParD1/3/4